MGKYEDEWAAASDEIVWKAQININEYPPNIREIITKEVQSRGLNIDNMRPPTPKEIAWGVIVKLILAAAAIIGFFIWVICGAIGRSLFG